MNIRFSQLRELVIDLPRPTRQGEQQRFIIREDKATPIYSRKGAFREMSELVEDGVLVAEYHYDETLGRDQLMWTVQHKGDKIILDMGQGVGYPWS